MDFSAVALSQTDMRLVLVLCAKGDLSKVVDEGIRRGGANGKWMGVGTYTQIYVPDTPALGHSRNGFQVSLKSTSGCWAV